MADPVQALAIATFLSAVIAFFFWPERGVWPQLQRARRNTERVLIEDALKHLYDMESKERPATLESVAGVLAVSRDQIAKLMARLEQLNLIASRRNAFTLTSEGRSYALRMIRVHRLWERYLADETGLPEVDWHDKAENLEHTTTQEQAENMAAQMGNPLYDPHGDPIPTPSGHLPPMKGRPLTDLEVGSIARITHLEDEPRVVYAQLIAEGLCLGLIVRVEEKSPERIRIVANGEEVVLAPVIAANVTVEKLEKIAFVEASHETLSSLNIGEQCEVIGISRLCRKAQRRRLMDLGLVPGTVVSAELRSASGNPTGYSIRGATIALRKEHADLIHIHRKEAA